MPFDAKLILSAVFATAVALRADLGTPPMPDDIKAYVGWILTGVIAGLTVVLGPAIADAVKAALRSDKIN